TLGSVVRDPITQLPFPNNQIPANRLSPTALAILNDTANYPLPNRTVSGVVGNYVGAFKDTTRAHQGDLRLDWNATAKDKVFARFSIAEFKLTGDTRAFPLILGTRQDAPFRNLGVNWNHVFNSTLTNELLLGYNEVGVVTQALDWGGLGNGNAKYGIGGGQPIAGLSAINWGGGLSS